MNGQLSRHSQKRPARNFKVHWTKIAQYNAESQNEFKDQFMKELTLSIYFREL